MNDPCLVTSSVPPARHRSESQRCAIERCSVAAHHYFALPATWAAYLQTDRQHFTVGHGEIPVCSAHATRLAQYWESDLSRSAEMTDEDATLSNGVRAVLDRLATDRLVDHLVQS